MGFRRRRAQTSFAPTTGRTLRAEAASPRGERGSERYLGGISFDEPAAAWDRVVERRRAVALARHFREAEGLSIAQVADRLGRSPATIKAYFYDPSDANKSPSDGPAR